MKILLLLSGLLFSGGLFADMDYVCLSDYTDHANFIAERCERNNILVITDIPMNFLTFWIAKWCRHDREINYVEGVKSNAMTLTCVLYDKKPRAFIQVK
tara:strand:+ start:279 stop:575 length:297 start_codon:yes stop_codon:yes gene_type:complete